MVTIYASRFNMCVLFILSSVGMSIMHTLSTCLGTVYTLIMPKMVTSVICILLFIVLGVWGILTVFAHKFTKKVMHVTKRVLKRIFCCACCRKKNAGEEEKSDSESESEDERKEIEEEIAKFEAD